MLWLSALGWSVSTRCSAGGVDGGWTTGADFRGALPSCVLFVILSANGMGPEAFNRSSNCAGVKTAHRKPTKRPLEHSCRNAINSQNCSRLRTLFHRPGRLPFEGLSFVCESDGGSVSSSSSSSTKRDLGSSGKRGMRQRSGKVGERPARSRRGSRLGCHFERRVGERRT